MPKEIIEEVRNDFEKRLDKVVKKIHDNPEIRSLLDRFMGYKDDTVVYQMTKGFFPGVRDLENLETTVSTFVNYLYDDGELFWVSDHVEPDVYGHLLMTAPEKELKHPGDAKWVQITSLEKLDEYLDAVELYEVEFIECVAGMMDELDALFEATRFKGYKKEHIQKLPEIIRKHL